MDVILLLVKLPVMLVIVFVIYVLPIALLAVSTIRLIFGFGTRKWLALAAVFSLPLSALLLVTKVRPFTLTMENTGLYGAAGLTLAATVFWYMGAIKTRCEKYWLEAVAFSLTSIIWIIYMVTTTKWIVG